VEVTDAFAADSQISVTRIHVYGCARLRNGWPAGVAFPIAIGTASHDEPTSKIFVSELFNYLPAYVFCQYYYVIHATRDKAIYNSLEIVCLHHPCGLRSPTFFAEKKWAKKPLAINVQPDCQNSNGQQLCRVHSASQL
jgi:hypothetical protein